MKCFLEKVPNIKAGEKMKKEIVIITGLSGSGKCSVLNVVEDLGFYSVNNLPYNMIKNFLDSDLKKVAIGLDIRSFHNIEEVRETLNFFKNSSQISTSIIFVEASEEIILNRYNLTRRKHPLMKNTLLGAIGKEREIMNSIHEISTVVIDTTNTHLRELIEKVKSVINIVDKCKDMNIHIQSFGFKYGIPIDVDLVFDVRFLPNPYYIERLKKKNGLNKEVLDYIMEFDTAKEFLKKLMEMFNFLIPNYIKEGKKHLSIGIGCSGGKHRSVTFVQMLGKELRKTYKNLEIYQSHREKERGNW